MINTRKDLKKCLKYEMHIYGKKRIKLFGPVLSERSIAWKYVCLLRFEEYHTNAAHRIRAFFFRFLKVSLGRKYCLEIPINVIDQGLMLFHPHFIIINAKKIGRNCSIQFGCSCVASGHDGSVPTLGDNIDIGADTIILGGISLANGIAVGANSTVNKSFEEENICIAGSPAKKISNNGSETWEGRKIMERNLSGNGCYSRGK